MTATVRTRELGKQIFEAQINAAGLRCSESSPGRRAHYRVSRSGDNGTGLSLDLKLTTSSNETFSLYKADKELALLVYVWSVRDSNKSAVYALTYDEAYQIMEANKHTNTPSWQQEKGGFSITHSGTKVKNALLRFRMTPEKWRERFRS